MFYIIYFVLFLHCLSYLLTGNIFLYKYLLLTMHKASRPMYLSDITIQLSGAKSHSRVHNQYKLHFCVYVYVLSCPYLSKFKLLHNAKIKGTPEFHLVEIFKNIHNVSTLLFFIIFQHISTVIYLLKQKFFLLCGCFLSQYW